jgi:hypothetical protein
MYNDLRCPGLEKEDRVGLLGKRKGRNRSVIPLGSAIICRFLFRKTANLISLLDEMVADRRSKPPSAELVIKVRYLCRPSR